MTQYLSKDSLFLKLPTELSIDEISLQDLYHDISSLTTTTTTTTTTTLETIYNSIINKTYYLLKSINDVSIALKLWQIRLTCHLFNNQLNYAKKELINLNNTLYLHENHNITPPPPLMGVSSTSISTSTSASASSLSLSNGSTPNITTTTTTNNPIYPLPKNNQLIIDFKLLILLLRLKNFPNMNLINELYKLIYQLRLKRNDNNNINNNNNDTNDINDDQLILIKNLQNLSYDNIVILTLTKNYLTLINFLNNLIQELQELNEKDDKLENMINCSNYEFNYYSNINLIYLIINLIVYHNQNHIDVVINDGDGDTKFNHIWNTQINQTTKNSLIYTLQHISPSLSLTNSLHDNNNDSQESILQFKCDSIQDLGQLIQQGKITGRIICSMLGIWDLSNTFGFILSNNNNNNNNTLRFMKNNLQENQQQQLDINTLSNDEIINKCCHLLNDQWCKYINKVYGLE